MAECLIVGAGGAVGAVLRYLIIMQFNGCCGKRISSGP